MTCKTCKHIDLRRREMVNQGFANCKLGPIWKYYPPKHSCGKWEAKGRK